MIIILTIDDFLKFDEYVFDSFLNDFLRKRLSRFFSLFTNWISIFCLFYMLFVNFIAFSNSCVLNDVDIWWSWRSIDEFRDFVETKIDFVMLKNMSWNVVFDNQSINVRIFDLQILFNSRKKFLFKNVFSMTKLINFFVKFVIFDFDVIFEISFVFDDFVKQYLFARFFFFFIVSKTRKAT